MISAGFYRRRSALLWIEGGLLALGAALGAWCVLVWIEARYMAHVPVPPPSTSITQLPGEAPGPQAFPAPAAQPLPALPALAPGAWIGRLEAPAIHLSATVLEGSDDHTLSLGAGHIEDTAFPGSSGNVGIAGHRDTIFRPVRNLKVGDALVLTTADQEFRYRVRTLRIVQPDDVAVLDPTDHPTLTLVTCYPFGFIGHAPQRFIVSAELVQAGHR